VQNLINGFCCVAVSLITQAAWKLSRKVATVKFTQTLLIFEADAQLLLSKTICMIALMVIGGVSSLFVEIEQNKEETDDEEHDNQNMVARLT